MDNVRQGRQEKRNNDEPTESPMVRKPSSSIKDRVKLYETQIEDCI
jgi:hypothetical protein